METLCVVGRGLMWGAGLREAEDLTFDPHPAPPVSPRCPKGPDWSSIQILRETKQNNQNQQTFSSSDIISNTSQTFLWMERRLVSGFCWQTTVPNIRNKRRNTHDVKYTEYHTSLVILKHLKINLFKKQNKLNFQSNLKKWTEVYVSPGTFREVFQWEVTGGL